MLCQQLRIFVFMAVAMVRLSAAAHFSCDNSRGYIFCHISLNPGNDFTFSEEDVAVDCTRDGKYCVRVESIPNDNTEWKIVVLNSGGGTSEFCYGVCPFQQTYDNISGTYYDKCQTTAC
jgi:hypothetical protein